MRCSEATLQPISEHTCLHGVHALRVEQDAAIGGLLHAHRRGQGEADQHLLERAPLQLWPALDVELITCSEAPLSLLLAACDNQPQQQGPCFVFPPVSADSGCTVTRSKAHSGPQQLLSNQSLHAYCLSHVRLHA